jgi:hypothetical protein
MRGQGRRERTTGGADVARRRHVVAAARLVVTRAFAAALLVLLAHPGCRTQDLNQRWGWKADRPITPMKTFSHGAHRNVFEQNGIECFACHTMTARITGEGSEAAAAEAIRASKEAFYPGKETCHDCHYNPRRGNTAPDRCDLCHLDVQAIQPANHNHDWMNRHGVFAKADQATCETCHRPSTCQNCHVRRDQSVRTVHDRTFRFTHGIAARANPMACGQCHDLRSFCTTCHTQGGYED